METFGYLAILTGALLIRQVAIGRAHETSSDFRDMFVATLQGDFGTVKEVAARRGTASDATVSGAVPTANFGTTQLLSAMVALGSGKPYVYGAEGPNAYDCSGLVWAACRKIGVYNGPRFTADSSMLQALQDVIVQDGKPQVGDIVLWSGHHVGVVSGPDRYYSAYNPTKGILNQPISATTAYEGIQPSYWVVKDAPSTGSGHGYGHH